MDIGKFTSKITPSNKDNMSIPDLNKHFSDKDKWPTFVNISGATEIIDSNFFEITCHIQSSLSCFKGHFPSQAVLPGVVQVNWVNNLARLIFRVDEFRGVNSLKFNTMILPETKTHLSLEFNPEKCSVKFSYKAGKILFSSGILVFNNVSY